MLLTFELLVKRIRMQFTKTNRNDKGLYWRKNWQLDSVYTDTGSGVNTNKNLLRMLEDAEQEKFDVIVAIDPSRILKNSDLSSVIGKLREENKVHIITVDKRIDTILKDNITL